MRLKAAVCVSVIAISFGPASAAGEDRAAELREKQELITSVNLLNGLHLSGEQMQKLLQINLEGERLRREYLAANEAKISEAERRYAELLDNFSEDRPAPEETERYAQALKQELQEADEAYRARVAELGMEIERMLTEGQRRTLATFKPCLIPPRDLREPARAGQASAASRGARVLENYRKMMQRAVELEKQARSRDAYRNSAVRNPYRPRAGRRDPGLFAKDRVREAFAERFFPRYFEWVEHTGELSEGEKSAEEQRILAVLDRGAAMSDEEFSLNLDQLSEEVFATLEAREGEMRAAMDVLAGRPGVPGRAARFLINPGLIPILEQRADKFAEGVNRQ